MRKAMFVLVTLAAGAGALTGCHRGQSDPAAPLGSPSGAVTAGASEAAHNTIPCALAGAKGFDQQCTVEQASEMGEQVLVIRHPDGGFRRFRAAKGKREPVAADGADQAVIVHTPTTVEVTVAQDRYRFPAAPAAPAAAAPTGNAGQR